MQCRAHCAPSCPALGRVARKGSQGIPHMKTIVLGAGIIGISTAWHLLERGHEVIVVDRQPDAALETSFANAAQISVSYCEPWANREAPLKALKWMFDKEAPLLFRPQMDWQQWRWGLQFLAQCNDAAFERNVQQIVALGAYSHAALKDLVSTTGKGPPPPPPPPPKNGAPPACPPRPCPAAAWHAARSSSTATMCCA